MLKGSWASIKGDPGFMRAVNGWLTILWVVMIPVSIVTGWIHSVTYVAALSLWALVSGHWSAWQAARTEVQQQKDEEKREAEDVPEEVVKEMLNRTELEPDRSNGSRAVRSDLGPASRE